MFAPDAPRSKAGVNEYLYALSCRYPAAVRCAFAALARLLARLLARVPRLHLLMAGTIVGRSVGWAGPQLPLGARPSRRGPAHAARQAAPAVRVARHRDGARAQRLAARLRRDGHALLAERTCISAERISLCMCCVCGSVRVLPRWADSAARKLRRGTFFSCADNPDESSALCDVHECVPVFVP